MTTTDQLLQQLDQIREATHKMGELLERLPPPAPPAPAQRVCHHCQGRAPLLVYDHRIMENVRVTCPICAGTGKTPIEEPCTS